MKWTIEFKEDCLNDLLECLEQGPIIEMEGQEFRLLNEEQVARINGSLCSCR